MLHSTRILTNMGTPQIRTVQVYSIVGCNMDGHAVPRRGELSAALQTEKIARAGVLIRCREGGGL